jgi:hypothetical protein
MAATPHDSTGTVFTFAGTGYTVTNIVVTNTDPATDNTIDVSHLGMTAGNSILTQTRPLSGSSTDTGRQVVVDYLGSSIIRDAVSGTLVLTIAGSGAISANATVTTSTLTLATNDVVKGQVTFKVARYT